MTASCQCALISRRRIRRSDHRRLWCFGLAACLGLFLVSGANTEPPGSPVRPLATRPSAPESREKDKNDLSPLDEPLKLLAEARKAYKNVKDYSCALRKREQIQGKLQPENVIVMKIRKEPFSVSLKWLGPRDLNGQEAVFVTGKNKNMMRVLPKGVAGLLGWMTVAPNDSRVMEHSRHLITEAGLGNLIERFATGYEDDKKSGKAKVTLADFTYDKRQCVRIETIRPDAKPGTATFYRSLLYLDKESRLPIRCECYDKARDGNKDGDLVEMYSFTNLKLNVGVGDEVFKR